MKKSKSISLKSEISADFTKKAYIDGYIGLVMESPSETAFLSPLEQLFYKAIRRDIESLCDAHNSLWDTNKDALNPDAKIVQACRLIENEVNALNDRMNDFLDAAFDNLSEKTIQAQKLNEKIAITLLSEVNERAFLYEKKKAKKSA
jgi:hypothetical protein